MTSPYTNVEVFLDGIRMYVEDYDYRQIHLNIHEAERLKSQLETAINALRAKEPQKKYIAVDFDGTLAHYVYGDLHKYGHLHLGAPIPAMVKRVKQWLDDGEDVRIFTARIAEPIDPQELQDTMHAIAGWCLQHIGRTLPITNVKDRQMKELWDDRAVGVYVNTGQRVGDAR